MILVMSMLKRREVTLENHGVLASGVVNNIQAEDSSGTSFNVTLDASVVIYLKRPMGMGTTEKPIKSHENVEEVRELFNTAVCGD